MSQLRRLSGPMRLVALGWYVALCIVGGILGGLWLDENLGTRPFFILLGLFVGLTAAFAGLYRMVSETVEADAQYTAKDDAAIAAARAAREAAGRREEKGWPEDDEEPDKEVPWPSEVERRARPNEPASDDQKGEQR